MNPSSARPATYAAAAMLAALGIAASLWWAQHSLGSGFLPHGYCLTWIPGLLWLHVVSDSLIALAYLSIPVTLGYFVRRRRDLPFGWIFFLFATFILACGATHAMDVWTLWNADYWLSGGVKAVTAGVSLTTAAALFWAIPRALALPSVAQLRQAKESLEREVLARREVEAELRRVQGELEQRVNQGTGALAQATALLDAVFDAAPVGVAIFDAGDRCVRTNPAMARFDGLPPPAAIARHLVAVRRSGGAQIGVEIAASRPLGAVYRYSFFPVPDAGGTPLVGAVCEDISERRAAEAERAHLLHEAQEANRLKDEFMARVSHELRTPLQAMMSWVDLLGSGRLDETAAERALSRIDHNVRLQARMISDLLDVSSVLSGTLNLVPASTDPMCAVRPAIEVHGDAARLKGVELRLLESSAAGTLFTDGQRLEQVLGNLIGNAVKYTPRGGGVEVRACWQEDLQGEHWVLEVRDSGIGLDAEDLRNIFKPFRRGRRPGAAEQPGLGLGLAIAHSLAERLGGSLEAVSVGVGRGATFTLRLPRHATSAAEVPGTAAAVGAAAALTLHGTRILYVEDEPDVAESTAQALRLHGADVEVAAEVEAAGRVLAAARTDVLVSDLRLGAGRSGFEVLRAARQVQPGLAAIAVSAYGGPTDLAATREAGFAAHLVKPVDAQTLAATIAAVLGRGR